METIKEFIESVKKHPDQRYLPHTPKKVPAGLIIVHNSVPARLQPDENNEGGAWREVGQGGFRIWRDRPSPNYVECKCGWAPHLGKHYRVKRAET